MTLQELYKKPEDKAGVCHYNKEEHRWELAPEYIQSVMPRTEYSDAVRKADAYSLHLYHHLEYRVSATFNFSFVEWLVNCTEEGQRMILKALKEQCRADCESSIESNAYASQISEKGKDFKTEELTKASVSAFAQEIMYNFHIDNIYINKKYYLGVTLGRDRYERWDY